MSDAIDPPAFYTKNFEYLADSFLQRYYSTDRSVIALANVMDIYSKMIEYFT